MTKDLTLDFIKKKSLYECLDTFDGAYITENISRVKSLTAPFIALAQKMIFGGYIKVRDEYAIFIHTVEFYYHEEEGQEGEIIEDEIVYHRNNRFFNRTVPYFPLMSLHSHWSGFDITFENPQKQYRASALIRKYVIYDLKAHSFIKLETSSKKDKDYFVGEIKKELFIDSRSSYLQYYLNGFSLDENDSRIVWIDNPNAEYYDVHPTTRKNAKDHEWAFHYPNKEEYLSYIQNVSLDK